VSETLGKIWWFSLSAAVLAVIVGGMAVRYLCEPGALFPGSWFVDGQCGDSDGPTPADIFQSFGGGLGLLFVAGFSVPLAINWRRMSFGTVALGAVSSVAIVLVAAFVHFAMIFPLNEVFDIALRSMRRLGPFLLPLWLAAMALAYVRKLQWVQNA
jgi:hypothetical protein